MVKLLVRLEAGVSPERLAPYRRTTSGLHEAVQLYEWNAALSAALWLDIGHLEVLVRNAIHDQLTAWCTAKHGDHRWYDDPAKILTPQRRINITEARRRLSKANKPDDAGRIVAELNFGFWRYLLSTEL